MPLATRLLDSDYNFREYTSNGFPVYSRVPSGALIMSDSNLTSYGFTFVNMGDRLIKAGGVGTVGTTWSGALGTISGSLSTTGSHFGTSTMNRPNANAGSAYRLWNQMRGDHSHTFSFSDNGSSGTRIPVTKGLGFYSKPLSDLVPAGAIVFSSNSPTGSWSNYATLYGNKWLAGVSSAASSGSNLGAASANFSTTSTSGGNHTHGTGTAIAYVPSTGNQITNFNTEGGSGDHVHSINITATYSINNYIKLKAWQTSTNALLSYGCIIPWNSNNQPPSGWYLCNGQTIRGYTTPNLSSGKLIQMHSADHDVTVSGTNSVSLSATAGNAGTHTHQGPLSASRFAYFGGSEHTSYSWPHTHGLSLTTGSTVNVDPANVSLAFIVYLP